MYDISIFAERLIAERKKKKLTQSDLAEKAKISAQTVSYYEKARNDRRLKMLLPLQMP